MNDSSISEFTRCQGKRLIHNETGSVNLGRAMVYCGLLTQLVGDTSAFVVRRGLAEMHMSNRRIDCEVSEYEYCSHRLMAKPRGPVRLGHLSFAFSA